MLLQFTGLIDEKDLPPSLFRRNRDTFNVVAGRCFSWERNAQKAIFQRC
ncbi:hypothetical protein VCRA2121O157_250078 [Vibrio crassostreae]|nr:hypothetical protein VCRA2113O137_210107 [Vibrio crassostreae]CAK1933413.1 hypothetical protein VCRA2113O138_250014 [Vibrio crassostreae]CAK1945892.1 hypothetical protein VCRA2113O140_250078 [Vibrio crassostreae]CAK2280665.1 hypothetical protein VCRA2116O141_180015 [Vibrio crassostreae]CAK2526356.1 hypothetical protein VCRA2113O415_630003 [Vibrio crassostreae]